MQKIIEGLWERAIGINTNAKRVYKFKKQNVQQRRQFAQYLMTSSKIEEVTIFIFKPKYL